MFRFFLGNVVSTFTNCVVVSMFQVSLLTFPLQTSFQQLSNSFSQKYKSITPTVTAVYLELLNNFDSSAKSFFHFVINTIISKHFLNMCSFKQSNVKYCVVLRHIIIPSLTVNLSFPGKRLPTFYTIGRTDVKLLKLTKTLWKFYYGYGNSTTKSL